MNETLFSAASLLTILSSLEEIDAEQIDIDTDESGITVSLDGKDYRFNYDNSGTAEVEVSESDMEEAQEVIETAAAEEDAPENVEASILSGTLKTLLVGGLVRLTSKLLK